MPTAEDSGRSRSDDCAMCAGSGTLTWEQPQPSGVLRTIEMPCPSGCGEHWKHPRAERDRVVAEGDAVPEWPDGVPGGPPTSGDPARTGEGNVAAANRIGAEFIRRALEHWGFAARASDPRDR